MIIRMTGQMISVTLPRAVRFQLIMFFLERALKCLNDVDKYVIRIIRIN